MLSGKKILLGVCGSIAAYKAAFLVRLLIKEGAEVKAILTPSAADFVTPLTLTTLSKNRALTDFVSEKGDWNNHVKLGLWADLFLIAPASANTIGKMAAGQCDNLLMAAYLSARCPVYLAPAMDLDMWKHPSTQKNISRLEHYGNKIIPVGTGELASGLEGEGRMAEPEAIISFLKKEIPAGSKKKLPFKNKKALITAGPTYEPIDPVRFIGNHSSGKMGIALAEAFSELGAEVTLIKGNTNLSPHNLNIQTIEAPTAKAMHKACLSNFNEADIIIMAAAVADYTPVAMAAEKIKKQDQGMAIELKKTKDILKEMGAKKKKGQILIGFALETENELQNAKKKLQEKNLDMIVLNSLRDKGAGFGSDTNKITIIDKNNNVASFELKDKKEAARDIAKTVAKITHENI